MPARAVVGCPGSRRLVLSADRFRLELAVDDGHRAGPRHGALGSIHREHRRDSRALGPRDEHCPEMQQVLSVEVKAEAIRVGFDLAGVASLEDPALATASARY